MDNKLNIASNIIIFLLLVIIILLIGIIVYQWVPNGSDATIKAIHKNVEERNELLIEHNKIEEEQLESSLRIEEILGDKEFIIEFID